MKDAHIEKLANSSIEEQIQDLRALFNFSPVERNALLAKQTANIAEYFVPGTLCAILENYPNHRKTLPLLQNKAKNDPDE
ncbi:hypothetical protein [Rivularia sp. UHCC 0363]|uniref:hypothetical protein n=1 Tax=Rivularia sp. UHCC 0363 TaxID=3110244 RepID=UPI002B1FB215|nr:hypothetical protein [Rivularia sp. UHCC 0363]MEA5593541.1 hypothetical protein [Rivularia sp. UHCC 0363]